MHQGKRETFKRVTRVCFIAFLIYFLFSSFSPSTIHSRFRIPNYRQIRDKEISLTFDDGPDPVVTPQILAILRKKNVKATFFVIGKKVKENPELTRAIINDGNLVGNHSFSHKLTAGWETKVQLKGDYLLAQTEIEKIIGKKPKLLRPPHGFSSPWFTREIKELGFQIVYWDISANDWLNNVNAQTMIDVISNKTKPGMIILLHDGLDNHIGSQTKLIEALPDIIDDLKQKGYSFVTVDQLLKVTPYF